MSGIVGGIAVAENLTHRLHALLESGCACAYRRKPDENGEKDVNEIAEHSLPRRSQGHSIEGGGACGLVRAVQALSALFGFGHRHFIKGRANRSFSIWEKVQKPARPWEGVTSAFIFPTTL